MVRAKRFQYDSPLICFIIPRLHVRMTMVNYSGRRRRFLQALGVASVGALAGCSAGSSEDRSLANQSSTVLSRLPKLEPGEYDGKAVTVQSFVPEQLDGYTESMEYLQTLDGAVPLTFDLDIASMTEAFIALDGAVVSLTLPEGESFDETLADPGTESGSAGSYTVYERDDGLIGVDGTRLLLVRPDDRVAVDTRELLERVADAEARDGSESTPTDRAQGAAETIETMDADHLLSVVVPFGRDVFGDESEYVSGARAVTWGMTVKEKDDGSASVESRISAGFPSGEAEKGPFLQYAHDEQPVDIDTSSVEGDVVTARGSRGSSSVNGENSYLRPRGFADAVYVCVRASQWEWEFDYPDHGVAGATEFVLPVDRTTVIEAFSTDVHHGLAVNPLPEAKVRAEPERKRYNTVTPPEIGDSTLFCTELCGEGHADHTAPVSVVDDTAFEEWISNA